MSAERGANTAANYGRDRTVEIVMEKVIRANFFAETSRRTLTDIHCRDTENFADAILAPLGRVCRTLGHVASDVRRSKSIREKMFSTQRRVRVNAQTCPSHRFILSNPIV